jgi:hypothetical protein
MSDAATIDTPVLLPPVAPPAPQATQNKFIKGKNGKLQRIGPKLKSAIDAMAYEGLSYANAAKKVGMSTRAVRLALDKPHVKQYYNQQIQVFLTSERARNIHRATEIRDQDDNLNAALNAGKWLHNPDSDKEAASSGSKAVQPGVVVTVNVNARSGVDVDETIIEVNPGGVEADG